MQNRDNHQQVEPISITRRFSGLIKGLRKDERKPIFEIILEALVSPIPKSGDDARLFERPAQAAHLHSECVEPDPPLPRLKNE